MASPASETLVLLEFLVEEVDLFYDNASDHIWSGKTALTFQFLDNEPLLVTEDESAKGNSRKGKSCLFSMLPHQVEAVVRGFDIHVKVYKESPPRALPRLVKVGDATVPMSTCLKELFKEECGCARVVNGSYPIQGLSGQGIGFLKVYIRISCFGKTIETQFQVRPDRHVEFRGNEAGYLFDAEEGAPVLEPGRRQC